MKKISQGRLELSTTKADAIKKFMQLPYNCRETLNDDNYIQFYCYKNGKIVITNPPSRYITNDHSTNLYAKILERDGKAYVVYYTSFSKSTYITKLIIYVLYLIMIITSLFLSCCLQTKGIVLQ